MTCLLFISILSICRIVTCSADRNAYVWVKQDDGTWKHTLVLLRLIKCLKYFLYMDEESKVLCSRILSSKS